MCYLLAYMNFFFVYLVIFSLTLSSFAFIFSLVSFTVVFVCIGACVAEKKKN